MSSGDAGAGGSGDAEALDFSSYDLDGLRDDIGQVLDFGRAVSTMTKWMLGLQLAVVVATWVAFAGRFDSGVWLGLFAVIAGVVSAPLAATVGGWVLARRRLDAVTEASSRVVEVVGLMHADVVRLRRGSAETSVQKVAVSILEEAVFPTVFGTVNTTAEGVLGPVGFLARRATRAPFRLVERSAIRAVSSLPDRDIGRLVDGATEAVGGLDGFAASIADQYSGVGERIGSIVGRVARTSLVVGFGLAVGSTVPIALWWLLGWLLT